MSGSTGSSRINRSDFIKTISRYKKAVLKKYKPYVTIVPSGSYNSDNKKNSFGDMDLLIQVKGFNDKAEAKKDFIKFIKTLPDDVIVPFQSKKYKGKKYFNSGEIVTISFPQPSGEFVQIDNIFCLDSAEQKYKQSFLDMPAQKQGLILGLVKVLLIEEDPEKVFKKLKIKTTTDIKDNQEFEFNISSTELQLRLADYDSKLLKAGKFKQTSRKVIWKSRNWKDVNKILSNFDLSLDFEDLIKSIIKKLKNPRSKKRIAGVFKSMISIKSGEIGTEKGNVKQSALDKVQKVFGESRKLSFKDFLNIKTGN